MKYSLDINMMVGSADSAMLDSFASALPAKLDAKVWSNEYWVSVFVGTEGNPILSAQVRFHNKIDAETIRDAIKTKITPTVLAKILPGSWLRIHTCDHDFGNRSGCQTLWEWRK